MNSSSFPNHNYPKFICFDGVDFTGKSTQAARLSEHFKSIGIKHIVTREPGGTEFGEKIRDILFDDSQLLDETAFSLFNASRVEHLEKRVLPAIQRGEIVICDRFLASTIVYQGILGKLPTEFILQTHKNLCKNFYPDITFIMDSNFEEIHKRKTHNTLRIGNHYDEVTQKNMEAKIDAFRNTDLFPFKCILIDASRKIEDVSQSIKQEIQALSKKNHTPEQLHNLTLSEAPLSLLTTKVS